MGGIGVMCLLIFKKMLNVPEKSPILSFRFWGMYGEWKPNDLKDKGIGLYSIAVASAKPWSSKIRKLSKAPSHLNSFGFHSFKTLNKFEKNRLGSVAGLVKNHGVVAEHADGYRSQKIEILAIAPFSNELYVKEELKPLFDGVIQRIATKLGVEYCPNWKHLSKLRNKYKV